MLNARVGPRESCSQSEMCPGGSTWSKSGWLFNWTNWTMWASRTKSTRRSPRDSVLHGLADANHTRGSARRPPARRTRARASPAPRARVHKRRRADTEITYSAPESGKLVVFVEGLLESWSDHCHKPPPSNHRAVSLEPLGDLCYRKSNFNIAQFDQHSPV